MNKSDTVITILQPGYLPWLGFFEQLYQCDIFILYDDVQYDRQGWRNRNRIKSAQGIQWLTVPVHLKFNEHPLITEVRIDNQQNWRKKHLLSIKQNYSKAPCYGYFIPLFKEAYSIKWDYLIDLDLFFIKNLAEILGLGHKKIIKSSSLCVEGSKIERLIKLCRRFNADTFYEGAAGRNYINAINAKDFAQQGIQLKFQDYPHPSYKQLHGDFIPYLSVIDLLFNHGDESLYILTNRNKIKVENV